MEETRMGSVRKWLALLAVLTAGSLLLQAVTPEEMIKSAAVLSFLRYSEWPKSVETTITVGVMGRPSFFHLLHTDLDGKPVNGRTVRVVELKPNSDLHCCQLIYLANLKSAETKQLLLSAESAHALTVGESEHFLDYGGAINLFIVDDRIGFEASLDTLDRCGVSISSNLLRLGQVRNRGKTGASR
jgi:YfiR/HmsC-like